MFFSRSKSKLGIDIGTSSIKIAQVKKQNQQHILETYGIVNIALETETKPGFDAIAETAQILKRLLQETKVTASTIIASLPNNIVFVTMIEMPEMTDNELKDAIQWEARRYVPLPLDEVTLSWSVLRQPGAENIKVLLTAVPNMVINNYMRMFKLAGLTPQTLEIEALALLRSLIGLRKEAFIIVDIGARITSLNLVDEGFLRVSRNLSVGGETISMNIAKSLKINFSRAEQFKRDMGLSPSGGQVPQAVRPPLEAIKSELLQLVNIFESGGGHISEIIFTGQGAKLPGLLMYMEDMGQTTEIGNPLKFVEYDPSLEKDLISVAPGLSVALGLAMRE